MGFMNFTGGIKPTTGFHSGGKGPDPDVRVRVYVIFGLILVVLFIIGMFAFADGRPVF
jgi:hypothetical protein